MLIALFLSQNLVGPSLQFFSLQQHKGTDPAVIIRCLRLVPEFK